MLLDNNTPILVGIAEVVEPLKDDLSQASSAQTLASRAAELALQDALDVDRLAPEIDVVVATRTFPDSTPLWPMPFGKSNNMPRSIAQRLNANPRQAIYAKAGGNTPQSLVNKWSEKLAAGQASMVLLAGAEVLASTKAAIKSNTPLNWAEDVEGSLEDQGLGIHGMVDYQTVKHNKVRALPPLYALCEVARMSSQQQGLEAYTKVMAELLAPLSDVAATNPYAMFPKSYSVEQIATPSEKNSYIAFPYTKAMVAKDGVNQAAALLLTTVGKARELGIDESKWVYLHGYAETVEKGLLEREDLSCSPALTVAYKQAVKRASVDSRDLDFIDIYSCFPIVVAEAKAALGFADTDKAMTETGGLPFFGGPGNNYSMHGIASVARKLRDNPKAYGLVGANGGVMHKHAVGVYSCRPGWNICDSSLVQAELDKQPIAKTTQHPEGDATIESYTVLFGKGQPMYAVIIGRLKDTGERFMANNFERDTEILQTLVSKNSVGETVAVASMGKGNRVALSHASLRAQMPPKATTLRDDYEFCTTVCSGNILEVTINRPESHNALHPDAHDELGEIFDVFEDDDNLWVAIITGAGDKAFCTGNDLKYTASGKPMWIPKTGFAGLTSRRRRKPLIAAINGFAMGGGMEIALASDIVIAAENAIFALPEVKVGLVAGAGGIQRLARQIPLKRAMDLLLTGRQFSAEEAERLDIINQVVPTGEAMQAARKYAARLCENSPSSIRLTKEILNETASYASIDDAVWDMPTAINNLFTSEDFMEGPRAFAEKRKPRWTGR